MRASGAGIQAYRAHGKHEIGVVFNIEPKYPYSDSAEDLAATRRAHAYMNEQFADPALLGSYPPELKEIFGDAWPDFPAEDFELTNQKVDFVGINYYTRAVLRAAPGAGMLENEPVLPPGEYTTMGWEVYPEGLRTLLNRVHRDYAFPAYYITENGAAFPDVVEPDGTIHDARRVAFLQGQFAAAAQAIRDGVPLRGYFIWSLMDNFEWGHGYTQRFGIVHVDYATQQRRLKDSARWYRQFLAARAAGALAPG